MYIILYTTELHLYIHTIYRSLKMGKQTEKNILFQFYFKKCGLDIHIPQRACVIYCYVYKRTLYAYK